MGFGVVFLVESENHTTVTLLPAAATFGTYEVVMLLVTTTATTAAEIDSATEAVSIVGTRTEKYVVLGCRNVVVPDDVDVASGRRNLLILCVPVHSCANLESWSEGCPVVFASSEENIGVADAHAGIVQPSYVDVLA